MTNYSDFDRSPPPAPSDPYVPLPVSKPFITYVLLGAILLVFILMELVGDSTDPATLIRFGANYGPLVMAGQTWRLFTSMFLHIGIAHLAFNAYALFIFGLEMERLYGPDRYLIIYILSGLFGSLASFAIRGPDVLSAGASGAIFGIIGMNLAFFMIHRETFGQFGRQRMFNTLFIIGINLVFGFTRPGIDNYAHLGGLIAGFAMGYALAPHYEVVRQFTARPNVVDTVTLLKRWWVPALAIIALSAGVTVSISFWVNQA